MFGNYVLLGSAYYPKQRWNNDALETKSEMTLRLKKNFYFMAVIERISRKNNK